MSCRSLIHMAVGSTVDCVYGETQSGCNDEE